MVVVLHTLGQGGILRNTVPYSSHYYVAWFLEIGSYCAVNCFALISGYVMYRSRPSVSRILQLWFQVIFYTILITGIFTVIYPDKFSLKSLIKAFFPISFNQYWYISAYFGLYLLIPVLNAAIAHIEKKAYDILLLSMFALYCFFGYFSLHDAYSLSSGYSMIWLCILYLLGAYLHKYNIAATIKKRRSFGLYILMVILTFLPKILLRNFKNGSYIDILVSYVSPTIVFSSISLFLVFANASEIRPLQKLIRLLAPASLGVYLIHVHPIVWSLVPNIYKSFVENNLVVMTLLIFAAAVGVYLMCSIIELVRIKLFAWFRIKKLCDWIERTVAAKFDCAYEKAGQ